MIFLASSSDINKGSTSASPKSVKDEIDDGRYVFNNFF